MFYLHARTHFSHCLLRLQALDTEPYDIFSKSYNVTQFKYMEVSLYTTHTFKICHNRIYLSQEPSNLPPQLLPACMPNKHIERTLLSSDYS